MNNECSLNIGKWEGCLYVTSMFGYKCGWVIFYSHPIGESYKQGPRSQFGLMNFLWLEMRAVAPRRAQRSLALSHRVHWNGFSPVWVLMCKLTQDCRLNDLRHKLQLYGFSPVSIFKFLSMLRPYHTVYTKRAFPSCAFSYELTWDSYEWRLITLCTLKRLILRVTSHVSFKQSRLCKCLLANISPVCVSMCRTMLLLKV